MIARRDALKLLGAGIASAAFAGLPQPRPNCQVLPSAHQQRWTLIDHSMYSGSHWDAERVRETASALDDRLGVPDVENCESRGTREAGHQAGFRRGDRQPGRPDHLGRAVDNRVVAEEFAERIREEVLGLDINISTSIRRREQCCHYTVTRKAAGVR